MSADLQQRLDVVRTAIARARQADRRMRLAQSLADDTGVQMAVQALQYNAVVMNEALSQLPPGLLEPAGQDAWAALKAIADVREDPFRPVNLEDLHRTVQVLEVVEGALDRVRTGG